MHAPCGRMGSRRGPSTLLTARVPHRWQPSPSCASSFSTKPSFAHWPISCGSVKPQPRRLYAARTCAHMPPQCSHAFAFLLSQLKSWVG